MATWKLIIEYDGTRYYGWQEQRGSRTVAGEVRAAAEAFFSKPVELAGAGRTDAGVHALGQVARLRVDSPRIKRLELLQQLNDRLPPDVNILNVQEAPADFDPRRDAVARLYLYQIAQRRTAFAKRFVWWVKDRLNEKWMSDAANSLTGRRDFARFCDKRVGDGSTIVVVDSIQFGFDGDLLLFRIRASHYLWKMVRRIVGALVEVGRGTVSAQEFAALLDPASKKVQIDVAAHTAPPSGLFLEKVVYRGERQPDELAAVFPVPRW